jgi:hypothetical protein
VRFCDKFEIKDGTGATAATLKEPSLFQKLCQVACPCGGNKLLLGVCDAAGDAVCDLRTPSQCCRCGMCICACSFSGPIKVKLNITEPGEPTEIGSMEIEAPRFVPMLECSGPTAKVTMDLTKMGAKATHDTKRALMALAMMADAMFVAPTIAPCA